MVINLLNKMILQVGAHITSHPDVGDIGGNMFFLPNRSILAYTSWTPWRWMLVFGGGYIHRVLPKTLENQPIVGFPDHEKMKYYGYPQLWIQGRDRTSVNFGDPFSPQIRRALQKPSDGKSHHD